MEETNTSNISTNTPNPEPVVQNNGQKQIAGAIILAGIIIAGAVLLKGGNSGTYAPTGTAPVDLSTIQLKPVDANDDTLGDPKAKVTLVMYEDFQCPWCEKIVTESETQIRNTYVAQGKVQLAFRNFAFLGTFVKPYVAAKDESVNAAQAAWCAKDQGKFWEYHDYLFAHQNGEDQGAFSMTNLKSFAKALSLNTATFNQCLASGQHAQDVATAKTDGETAGVNGTPKGFILKNGKIVDTIDGYMPYAQIQAKLDKALK